MVNFSLTKPGILIVADHLALLKRMLNVAIQWGYLAENPFRVVLLLRENNRRLRYLTEEEIQKLIAFCHRILNPMVITALHTGMRRGEIFSLQWECLDLKNRLIEVRDSKNGEKLFIPINDTLLATLHRLPHRIDTPYVFPGQNGGKRTDIEELFWQAREKAGLEDVRFHDLRHTFASHLVMAGIDLMTARELLGHKSIKMTERYAHLSPDHNAKAVMVLDSLAVKKATATGAT